MKTATVYFQFPELKDIIKRHMSEVYGYHSVIDNDVDFDFDHDTHELMGVSVSIKIEPKKPIVEYAGR